MTLATVAYRISMDVSFAAMLQKNVDEALHRAGIILSVDETRALKKVLAAPGQLLLAGLDIVAPEPWAVGE